MNVMSLDSINRIETISSIIIDEMVKEEDSIATGKHPSKRINEIGEAVKLLRLDSHPTSTRQDSDNVMTMLSGAQAEIVRRIQENFSVGKKEMKDIVDKFVQDMRKGLANENQTVAMLPSFVTGRISGLEQGTFLAVDLGGSNLRVVQVTLKGKRRVFTRQASIKIPDESSQTHVNCKTGEARHLFHFICLEIKHFLNDAYGERTMPKGKIPLAFTFSFPVHQTALDAGFLKRWTKGFDLPDFIGADAVRALRYYLAYCQISNVEVVAMVNDTVGTLLSHAYTNDDIDYPTQVGMILGTGSNCAYAEQVQNITKRSFDAPGDETMYINMESGAFDEEKQRTQLNKINKCYHLRCTTIAWIWHRSILENNLLKRELVACISANWPEES